MSESKIGNNNPFFQKEHSQKTKEHLSRVLKEIEKDKQWNKRNSISRSLQSILRLEKINLQQYHLMILEETPRSEISREFKISPRLVDYINNKLYSTITMKDTYKLSKFYENNRDRDKKIDEIQVKINKAKEMGLEPRKLKKFNELKKGRRLTKEENNKYRSLQYLVNVDKNKFIMDIAKGHSRKEIGKNHNIGYKSQNRLLEHFFNTNDIRKAQKQAGSLKQCAKMNAKIQILEEEYQHLKNKKKNYNKLLNMGKLDLNPPVDLVRDNNPDEEDLKPKKNIINNT